MSEDWNHKDTIDTKWNSLLSIRKSPLCLSALVSSWLRFLSGPAVIRVLTHSLPRSNSELRWHYRVH